MRFVFQSQPVPVCLAPVGLYLAMCQYVPRTWPNRSKQLLVGTAEGGHPEQCCLAGSYEVLGFLNVKNKWWVQVCRGVGMLIILLTFIVSSLYIKEATNLCRK